MKKTFFCLVLMLFSIFFCWQNVNAECTYKEQSELNKAATNIKAGYTDEEKEITPRQKYPDSEEYIEAYIEYYVNVYVYNITSDMYVTIANDFDNSSKTYQYSDTKEGKITIEQKDISKKYTYTIKVYSAKAGCKDNLLRTLEVETPRLNPYLSDSVCNGIENYSLCQKYVSTELKYGEFLEKVHNYKEKNNLYEKNNKKEDTVEQKEWYENAWDFIKEYYIYIISGVVVVGIGATIIIIEKRRRRVI